MNVDIQTEDLAQIIRYRRTIKPDKMNGRVIEDHIIEELISLSDWAPTHAKTEPWRFIVFGNKKVKHFAVQHAEILKQQTPEASFTQIKYDNLVNLGNNVSHVIVAWMKRVPNHKIPEIEEVAATSCAIQNLLLAATAKGIATFWSTGGMTHHPAFKSHFNIGEEDRVLGILYLGYTDEPFKEGSRIIPLTEKTEWRK